MIADLHVHSHHSKDSKSKVKDIVYTALKRGLNALAITDHDTLNGSLEAVELVREENLDLLILPGMEVSTSDGHLLAYGISREVDSGMSMVDTIKAVKNLGGLAVVAHPFQFYRHGLVKFWIVKEVDAVEVFNSKYLLGICNFLAKKLADFYKKPGTAGSDAHKAEEVGRAVTIIDCPRKVVSISEVLEAIKAGKTSVTGGRQKLRNW